MHHHPDFNDPVPVALSILIAAIAASSMHAVRAALAAILLCCAAGIAMAADDLYRGQTIVTGQGEANRQLGFASCLEDVLVKVSGQFRLAGDPRLEPYKARAAALVRAYDYRDEKGGKPKNDEQGTRDRSFFLTVDFDEAGVDGVLAALGVKPWLSRRPVLALFVEMQPGARRDVVAIDSRQTDLQRQSLLAAAARRGMSVVLPDAATLAKIGASEETIANIPPAKLAAVAAGRGGQAVVTARLVWDDRELHWNADWQLDWQGKPRRWQLTAVTFDEAFRQGIGNAAQIIAEQQ